MAELMRINEGEARRVTIISKPEPYVTPTGDIAPSVRVRENGKEYSLVLTETLKKELQRALGNPNNWVGKEVMIEKVRRGRITKFEVSVPFNQEEEFRAEQKARAVEVEIKRENGETQTKVMSIEGRIVTMKERPYSVEITRGQRGSYGFTVKVHSESLDRAVEEAMMLLESIEQELAKRAGNGKAQEEQEEEIPRGFVR